ncbi:MAG: DUF3817 domain-containing protein [Ornithinimicrobium sp.]|uniref:DUF3817 domain-containing protein n=1 Tax=Ornithinimicrobium sp. TaxID=1977084 RepID=UPI0026E09C5F|nr:DUF3817 domain-containing protein [Ornithinimicrobium sp.]MDO5740643.1 DUF3817 domain-containing protein [Ornithinimicrobium sp.]
MTAVLSCPRRLFRILAAAEMVTWTLLLAGMVGKYVLDAGDLPVRVGGSVHGFVFLVYALITVVIGVDQQWPRQSIALGLASAVIPYATVPFERSAERRGLLGDRWRLLSPGTSPDGAVERLVEAGLRRPVLAAVLGVVGVAVTFSVLLALGPPTEWFA